MDAFTTLLNSTRLEASQAARDLLAYSPFLFFRLVVAGMLAYGFGRLRAAYSCGRFLEQLGYAWWLFAVMCVGFAGAEFARVVTLYIALATPDGDLAALQRARELTGQVETAWTILNNVLSFLTTWFFAAAAWMLHGFPKKRRMRGADIAQVASLPLAILIPLVTSAAGTPSVAAMEGVNIVLSLVVTTVLAVQVWRLPEELSTRNREWFRIARLVTVSLLALYGLLQIPYRQVELCRVDGSADCLSTAFFRGSPSTYAIWLFSANAAVGVGVMILAALILPAGRGFESDRQRVLELIAQQPTLTDEALVAEVTRAGEDPAHYRRVLAYMRVRRELRAPRA